MVDTVPFAAVLHAMTSAVARSSAMTATRAKLPITTTRGALWALLEQEPPSVHAISEGDTHLSWWLTADGKRRAEAR